MSNEIQKVEVAELKPEPGYSDGEFWQKLRRFARRAGLEVVEKALWLYYALQRPETPAWAKRTIIGALAYFILPLDFIPDLAPFIGFTDDLSMIMLAIGTVSVHITPAVKEQARQQVEKWFGVEQVERRTPNAES